MSETTAPMTAAQAVALPVTCGEPNCTNAPVSQYTWAWGEVGYVCAQHQFLISQRAKNLKRTVTFMSLGPAAPAPLTRDERTQLHAARLSAEDEMREAQGRTARLYDQNQVLAAELGKSVRQRDELQSELTRLNEALTLLTDRHDTALEELQTAKDEVVRLQTLVDALQGARVAPVGSEG